MIDHPILQTVAATTMVSSIIGMMPLIFGIPAAIYYSILIYELVTGKKFKDFFRKK